jgi:hypothetical protein
LALALDVGLENPLLEEAFPLLGLALTLSSGSMDAMESLLPLGECWLLAASLGFGLLGVGEEPPGERYTAALLMYWVRAAAAGFKYGLGITTELGALAAAAAANAIELSHGDIIRLV